MFASPNRRKHALSCLAWIGMASTGFKFHHEIAVLDRGGTATIQPPPFGAEADLGRRVLVNTCHLFYLFAIVEVSSSRTFWLLSMS